MIGVNDVDNETFSLSDAATNCSGVEQSSGAFAEAFAEAFAG